MSAEEKPKATNSEEASAESVDESLTEQTPAEQTPDVTGDAAAEEAPETAESDVLDFGDAKLTPEEVAEPDLEPEAESPNLEEELAAAQAKADENWERVLRMQADMENQRKRAQRDVEHARKYALESIINDLLPVKDSLEMGITAARETDADASKIIEGSDLTLKMLAQAFDKYNISEINPVDEKFDPELHQAMSMQEVEGKDSNTVTGVLQKGYTLNGRLLRPALVMVAK